MKNGNVSKTDTIGVFTVLIFNFIFQKNGMKNGARNEVKNDRKTSIFQKWTLGMLMVRIFGQFSFHFPIQFLIENESKNESKSPIFIPFLSAIFLIGFHSPIQI